MKYYTIDREIFTAMITQLLWDKNAEIFYDAIYGCGETGNFIFYYSNDEETIYIINKDSGDLVSWYKPVHIGRALETNRKMTENVIRRFMTLFIKELYKEDDKWLND